MKIRFQADASLDSDVGRGVVRRERTIDWQEAQGVLADGTPDPDVLRFSALQGRVLVTGDVATMLDHFVAFTQSHFSPGVVLIAPTLTIGEAIERLVMLWVSRAAEDIENQAWWL